MNSNLDFVLGLWTSENETRLKEDLFGRCHVPASPALKSLVPETTWKSMVAGERHQRCCALTHSQMCSRVSMARCS